MGFTTVIRTASSTLGFLVPVTEGSRGVTEQTEGRGLLHTIIERTHCFSPGVPPRLGPLCPPPEERHLSMPENGEKERNYLFKSYTDLE